MEVNELQNKKKELNKDLRILINKRITQFCTECGVLVDELDVELGYYYPGLTIVDKKPTDATCNSIINLTLNI